DLAASHLEHVEIERTGEQREASSDSRLQVCARTAPSSDAETSRNAIRAVHHAEGNLTVLVPHASGRERHSGPPEAEAHGVAVHDGLQPVPRAARLDRKDLVPASVSIVHDAARVVEEAAGDQITLDLADRVVFEPQPHADDGRRAGAIVHALRERAAAL